MISGWFGWGVFSVLIFFVVCGFISVGDFKIDLEEFCFILEDSG
jgi:hypothetical protein